jgi:hypothetical protein
MPLVATNTICATPRTFNNIIRFRARQTIQLWQGKLILDDFVHHSGHFQVHRWVSVQRIEETIARFLDLRVERMHAEFEVDGLRVGVIDPGIPSHFGVPFEQSIGGFIVVVNA